MGRRRIGVQRGPTRISLDELIWVETRQLHQHHKDAAERRAKRAAREIANAGEALSDYGLEDCAPGELFDQEDLNVMAGTGLLLYAVELGFMSIVTWGGFDLPDGQPAEEVQPTRRAIAQLFMINVKAGQDVTYSEVFLAKALTREAGVAEEGNASAVEPSGNGAPTASADVATTEESPAPKGSPSEEPPSPGKPDSAL
ncbi:hypothetical protein [Maricaulis maris]|uniref:hypothetical protein n=1 Tax=Maricaulis maris TaxID=74318 RepID=UPI003B8B502C